MLNKDLTLVTTIIHKRVEYLIPTEEYDPDTFYDEIESGLPSISETFISEDVVNVKHYKMENSS